MEKRYMMMSLADILETEDIKQQLINGINDVVKKHDKFEHTYECIRNHVLTQIIASRIRMISLKHHGVMVNILGFIGLCQ